MHLQVIEEMKKKVKRTIQETTDQIMKTKEKAEERYLMPGGSNIRRKEYSMHIIPF